MILFEKIENFQNDFGVNSPSHLEALESLKKTGLPHRRVEAWKYTNITEKMDKDFSLIESNDFEKELPFDCELIRVSNGKLLDQSENFKITKLEMNEFNQDLDDNDALYLYNTATATHHYKINFIKSSQKPIVFYHLIDDNAQMKSLATQVEISIASNIKIELFEIHETAASTLTSQVQKITLEDNAKLFHYVLTRANEESNTSHLYTKALVKRDAEYQNIKIMMENALTRNEIKVLLTDEGAHAEAHGLYALNNKEHCDTSSLIHHIAPHTTSSQLYKGLMANESRGVFTGLVKVEKNAQLIDSNQLNKNLLLSKKAHANSRPQLEIFADDVKCSHGSTTGQISPEELFYFVSRGIKPARARKMLSQAFAFDIILKIQNTDIKNFIQDEFTRAYQGLEEV